MGKWVPGRRPSFLRGGLHFFRNPGRGSYRRRNDTWSSVHRPGLHFFGSFPCLYFFAQSVEQRESNLMTDVDFTLDLRIVGDPVHIDLAEIHRQPTWASALSLCANKSGLQDKLIAADVGVDNAVWSRFKTGQNAPSGEQLDKLMTRCGNEAPLFWLLLRRGYDPRSLRKLETETECALREAREALDAERLKVRVLTAALRGEAA